MPSPEGQIAILSVAHGTGWGAESVLGYLLQALDKQTRKRIVLITPDHSHVQRVALDLGMPTVIWPATAPSSLLHDATAFLRFQRSLADLKVGLIHGWHGRTFEWAALLARQLRVPLTGTTHDHPTDPGYGRFRLALMRLGAQRMRNLACVSQAMADACTEAGWNVPLTVIRNGLPLDAFQPAGPTRAHRPVRIAFLGANEAKKGGSLVFEAARNIPAHLAEWNVYGAQTSASPPEIQNWTHANQPAIHLHGSVPSKDIYAANDIVFHPSLRFDPYPTVLLEAAACGLPVVAARVGGAPEIVRAGETGFLFDPATPQAGIASLLRLIQDEGLRNLFAQSARQHAINFLGSDEMAAAYLSLWNDSRQTKR